MMPDVVEALFAAGAAKLRSSPLPAPRMVIKPAADSSLTAVDLAQEVGGPTAAAEVLEQNTNNS
jgi:hypothetical protein